MTTTSVNQRDIFFTSRDGLRLHASAFDPVAATRGPVICLPGLTRNAHDFDMLSDALQDQGHPVLSVDYRGRGASEYDADWRNYSPIIETLDVTDLMACAGVHSAHFIGTSRGGLISMIMGAVRPTALRSVVLNDVGPVLEQDGLARIIGYVGRVPVPANWDEATDIVRDLGKRDFTAVEEGDWEVIARQWFKDEDGRPVPGYDKRLSNTITNATTAIPELWPQFRTLSRFPVMVIRGENSDLLSVRTVEQMAKLHPQLKSITVPGQGHAPLLRDAPTIDAIVAFLEQVDAEEMPTVFNGRAGC